MGAKTSGTAQLPALDDEYEEGSFPGAGMPQELADTDMDAAKHRYLRAVWEAEPVLTRAAALVEAIKQVTYIGGRARLTTLEATRRESLPDLDRVLPELIEILREVPAGIGFAAEARELLGEATEWHRGVDGLADLARAPGPEQAAAYRDWVDALIHAGRLDEAQVAAAEPVSSHADVALAERYRVIPRDRLLLSSLLTDELNRRQPTTEERQR